MSIGFQVLERARKVGDEWVARYREVPVANVSDSMNRMTAGGARLRPMHREGVLCGPALTVKRDQVTTSCCITRSISLSRAM